MIYPNKPNFKKKEDSILKTGLTLALFLISFYWLLNKDIKMTLVLALALLIHELGHFITMKVYGYVDLKIFFIPFLGIISAGDKNILSQKERTIVLMAGPLPGILIGLGLYCINDLNPELNLATPALIFIMLNVFKLLPLAQLDGGELIETLFFPQKETIKIFFSLSSAIIVIVATIYFDYYRLLLIPFFIIVKLIQYFILKNLKNKLDDNNVDYSKSFDQLTNKEYWKIRTQIIKTKKKYSKISPDKYIISSKEESIVNIIKSLTKNNISENMTKKLKLILVIICLTVNFLPLLVIQDYLDNKKVKSEVEK